MPVVDLLLGFNTGDMRLFEIAKGTKTEDT